MSGEAREFAEMDIYDRLGRRKYLNGPERRRFAGYAETLPLSERTFCLMFFFTGARISEILELTPDRLDIAEGVVVIRSLKRRRKYVFRAIHLPNAFLRDLSQMALASPEQPRLWNFSRKKGYRIIIDAMRAIGVSGAHACPKGIRHAFGMACAEKSIPLPTISKWMGHSSIKTTSIYLNAIGQEERNYAKRIWDY
jgi:integrase/recombinase XerD